MRDHKYKVWDKHKKVFIPTDVWAIVQTDFNAFGIMLKDWEDYKEGEYFYKDSQELIQFTGLRDRNGREIYEGDIVSDDKEKYLIWIEPAKTLIGGFNKEWDEYFTYIKALRVEVIGNIHEKPELI